MKKINLIIMLSIIFALESCTNTKDKFINPDSVSPDIYQVLFENDVVKVMKVTFQPNQSDKTHDHHPMTFHALKGGKIEVTLPDGKTNERNIPTGATGFNSDVMRHQVKNIGDNTIEILLVENKYSMNSEVNGSDLILPEEVSPDVYKILLDNDKVKVTEATFEPDQSDKMHEHGVMTFYTASGGKAQNTLADGTVREMEISDNFTGHGEKILKHQMKNIGEKTIKVILVEHKTLEPVKG